MHVCVGEKGERERRERERERERERANSNKYFASISRIGNCGCH